MPSDRRPRRSRAAKVAEPPQRAVDYSHLKHPFNPQTVISEDAVAEIHATALRTLQELGVKILWDEARKLFRKAGAKVDDDSQMVFIGPEIIEEALKTAPKRFRLMAADPRHCHDYADGAMLFSAGAGCPNATDLVRGRRPGSLQDFEETIKLQQSFDVIHIHGPSAEPQDVPVHLRHYATMRTQLAYGSKQMFIYSRGHAQVQDCFDMVKLGLNLTEDQFASDVWCKTIINTNSPRQIDVPMAQGIVDFARAGQLLVITPFCLAGAMAPISVAGAIMLQHAECLAAIALAQLAKPGAPVSYGGFSSNVDMRSGAPAFGTPEHIKLTIATGQMARHVGLPWRSAAGSAGVTNDMQSAGENHMGLWGALQANATLTVHAAGWLEGGLTFGYEKFINDVEALQTIAELCTPVPTDTDSIGMSALAEVDPGGHFFGAAHTMERYRDAFYDPLVADLSNFGTWKENGAVESPERATAIWQRVLETFEPPAHGLEAQERVAAFIEKRTAEGGAPVVD